MESQLHQRGRREYTLSAGPLLRRLVYALLSVELLLVLCTLGHLLNQELAVLLIAVNSVLLIWSAVQLRKRPSCCR